MLEFEHAAVSCGFSTGICFCYLCNACFHYGCKFLNSSVKGKKFCFIFADFCTSLDSKLEHISLNSIFKYKPV